MYRAFEGDLLLPIVLGEIGLRFLRTALAETDGRLAYESLATRAPTFPYRLSELSAATGVPRETARRKVKSLLAHEWLLDLGPGRAALSPRAVEYFGFDYNAGVLDDFLWVGARLREALGYDDDALRRADLRKSLATALATREEGEIAHLFSTQFTPPFAAQRDRLGEHFLTICEQLLGYWMRHLHRLSRAFGGDLLLPLLLGEVAHYNVGALIYRQRAGLATLDALIADHDEALYAQILRPCNAHSLSLVTQVPDSSVRRKLAALVERNWLAELPDGTYVVTAQPAREFEELNVVTLQDFLDTDARLRALLVT
jgi:hypothetical protein